MKLLEKPKFTTAHSRAGTKRALLGCAGHLLGGFVLSAGAVAGGCSPFAVALVAVSGRRDFLFSALGAGLGLSLIHISEPTRQAEISYAVFCLKKKKKKVIKNEDLDEKKPKNKGTRLNIQV